MKYYYVFTSVHTSHLDLSIFPTRRSSDLEVAQLNVFVALGQHRALFGASENRLHVAAGQRAIAQVLPDRSEEHTSELQSLRHLVCRLLLEKKKSNEYIITNS